MAPFHRPLPKGKVGGRIAVVAQARRLAAQIGIPVEEIIARRRAGLRWCGQHGWENEEQARACHTAMIVDLRDKAIAAGLCGVCRRRPLVTKNHCEKCRQADNARRSEAYRASKAKGEP